MVAVGTKFKKAAWEFLCPAGTARHGPPAEQQQSPPPEPGQWWIWTARRRRQVNQEVYNYYEDIKTKQCIVKQCQLTSVGISTRANCSLNSGEDPVRSPTIAKPDKAILHSRGRFSLRDSMKGWP